MELPILVEPLEGGRYRASAGQPFGLSAEADSATESVRQLEQMIADRCKGERKLSSCALL